MAALTVLLAMQSGAAAQEEDQEETPQWVTLGDDYSPNTLAAAVVVAVAG